MTDKPKTITEALAQVRRIAPAAPVAKPQNPYEKYGANSPDAGPAAFFRADREAMASRAAPPAPSAPTAAPAAAPKPTSSVPLPPKRPASLGGSAAPAKPAQGNDGSQLGGYGFGSKADRLNQEKVNAALGPDNKLKAGSAEANMALLKHFKSQGPAQPAGSEASQAQADALNKAIQSKGPTGAERLGNDSSMGPSGEHKTPPAAPAAAPTTPAATVAGSASPPAAPSSNRSIPGSSSGTPTADFESGGKPKGKKKMSESTLINAFLKLQETRAGNVFEVAKKMKGVCPHCGKKQCECESMEEAKELSPKQKKIAALAGDKNKLDAADFKALRAGKRPIEEDGPVITQDPKNPLPKTAMDRIKDNLGIASKSSVDPNYKPAAGASEEDKAALKKKIDDSMKEEVGFSQAELEHFASVFEAMAVDQGKTTQTQRTQMNRAGRSMGDTVPTRDLTDEYVYETAKKDPSQLQKRGRKAGVKVGAYKMKGMDDVAGDEAKAEPKNLVAQNPRTYSKGDKNVVDLEHPSQKGVMRTVPAKEYNTFRTSYFNTEKPANKQRMHDSMVDRVFGKS